MGVSVFSGMATTAGAGAFLFLCKITIFTKFAVIIVSTCAVSFLTSMLFFGAAMHAFGPQNGWGNLIVCNFCLGINPEGEDESVKQLMERFEIEERQPKTFYEMMHGGGEMQ